MGIIAIYTDVAGQINFPNIRRVKIITTDNLATVTTAGYLNSATLQGYTIYNTDEIVIWYGATATASGVTNPGTLATFSASISNGIITLVTLVNPGDVLLPVVGNHIAIFNGTTGQITGDLSPAINGGNIQAGLSGTAGTLASFPATAANGSFIFKAINNSGGFNSTISNTNVGQATVYSLPDPGAATANIILSASGSAQTISGGLTISTGNLGVTAGNVTAGSSGNAGILTSFPATASNGSLIIAAVNNASGFNTTISNAASVGQAQVVSVPDGGAATSNFIISNSAGTQTIATGSLALTTGNVTATAGNLQAGSSGHAGTITAFPATASNGSLVISAVNNTGGFNTTISNTNIGQATVYSLPDPVAATSNFVLSQSSIPVNKVAFTVVRTIGFASLSTAAKVNIVAHPSGTSQFAVLDIKVLTSTGLSGGGGNRLLAVSDGTIVYNNAGITAALLGTPIFTIWGGTGNPVAVGTAQISTAGADIYFQYTGGTTDYTAGQVTVAVTLVQVTA